MVYKNRIDALRKIIEKNKIDALLITNLKNIFYLTSLCADKLVLVAGLKEIFVITDFIYAEAVSKSLKGVEIRIVKGSYSKSIARAVKKHKIKNLAFESRCLSFFRYRCLKKELGERVNFLPAENIVESLRETKEGKEILAIKKSLRLAARVFNGVKNRLRPQNTEQSVARYIREAFIKEGSEGHPFDPIVATQPSASQPHYVPGRKKLGNNKVILIDMGCVLGRYNCDLTRMCLLGKIRPKLLRLYNTVIKAQDRAIKRIKPGVRIYSIDRAARQLIDNEGFGKYFGHALGHGIGLEIHESPQISQDNKGILKEGMVFTIEPGIYIPGFGGVRIEDMVCVRKNGCEVLSRDIDKSI